MLRRHVSELRALPRCLSALCWSTIHGCRKFVHFIDRLAAAGGTHVGGFVEANRRLHR
jgi:hypothetical protein